MDYCILISIYGEPPLLLLAPFGLLPTVPIGLIIYAARNQYNHWDEEHLRNRVNEWVFNTLATRHGIKGAEKFKDPAFDLNNKMIQIFSSNVVFILGWHSYDLYLADMENLLI
jgi:hypothetical protein